MSALPPELAAETSDRGLSPKSTRGLRHSVRAFTHRDYAIFWVGATISTSGTWLGTIVVPVIVYSLTESPIWLGIAVVCQLVPAAAVGPWAGWLSDRLPRRHLLLWTQAGLTVAAASMWLLWAAGVHELWAVLVPVALQGVLTGLTMPSWQAFVHDLVPRADLRSAVAFNSLQFNLGRAIGPAIGGLVLATWGPDTALLVNAVSFAAVLAALALMRTDGRGTGGRDGILRGFTAAAAIIATTPSLRTAVLLAVAVGFLGNPVFNLTVVFAEEVYGVGALELGLLNAALGLGAVLAVPLVSGWSARLSLGNIVRGGLIVYTCAFVALGIVDAYVAGLVCMLLIGTSFLAVISSANTAMQLQVHDAWRGRVIAVRTCIYTAFVPLGALVQSVIAEAVGIRWSMIVVGACFLIVWLALDVPRRGRELTSLDEHLRASTSKE